MKFLLWLQSIRNPFFDWFFTCITHLGDETAFLLIAIFLFWCVNKRAGYYLMMSGFLGTIINQVMKLACKVPRPWDKNPRLTVVGNAKEAAGGYSFPSGHSQNAVNTFGAIFMTSGKRWLRILCIVIAVLVPISRMYLGVHTPWDVIAGSACAVVILIALENLFKSDRIFPIAMPIMVGVLALGSIAFFTYSVVSLKAAPGDVNVQSAFKNAATMLGCALGLILVYPMDAFIIKFETKATWYAQVFKLVGGGAIVFLLKALLKTPLSAFMGDYERIVRYFLIVAFAGVVWPLTFGFFSRLRIEALEGLSEEMVSFAKREKKGTVASELQGGVAKTPAKYTLNTSKDFRKISAKPKTTKKTNTSADVQPSVTKEAKVDTGDTANE